MANTTSANDIKNQAQATGAKAAEHASTLAGQASEKAKDLASSAADKARDVASSAAQTARTAASAVGREAEDLTERFGGSVASMGDSIRRNAPREGYLGQAAGALADTVESGGRYIEREGLSGMADDLTTLVKNNPIPALLVGFGLGFLLARITRS
jgi:hypothetical protein